MTNANTSKLVPPHSKFPGQSGYQAGARLWSSTSQIPHPPADRGSPVLETDAVVFKVGLAGSKETPGSTRKKHQPKTGHAAAFSSTFSPAAFSPMAWSPDVAAPGLGGLHKPQTGPSTGLPTNNVNYKPVPFNTNTDSTADMTEGTGIPRGPSSPTRPAVQTTSTVMAEADKQATAQTHAAAVAGGTVTDGPGNELGKIIARLQRLAFHVSGDMSREIAEIVHDLDSLKVSWSAPGARGQAAQVDQVGHKIKQMSLGTTEPAASTAAAPATAPAPVAQASTHADGPAAAAASQAVFGQGPFPDPAAPPAQAAPQPAAAACPPPSMPTPIIPQDPTSTAGACAPSGGPVPAPHTENHASTSPPGARQQGKATAHRTFSPSMASGKEPLSSIDMDPAAGSGPAGPPVVEMPQPFPAFIGACAPVAVAMPVGAGVGAADIFGSAAAPTTSIPPGPVQFGGIANSVPGPSGLSTDASASSSTPTTGFGNVRPSFIPLAPIYHAVPQADNGQFASTSSVPAGPGTSGTAHAASSSAEDGKRGYADEIMTTAAGDDGEVAGKPESHASSPADVRAQQDQEPPWPFARGRSGDTEPAQGPVPANPRSATWNGLAQRLAALNFTAGAAGPSALGAAVPGAPKKPGMRGKARRGPTPAPSSPAVAKAWVKAVAGPAAAAAPGAEAMAATSAPPAAAAPAAAAKPADSAAADKAAATKAAAAELRRHAAEALQHKSSGNAAYSEGRYEDAEREYSRAIAALESAAAAAGSSSSSGGDGPPRPLPEDANNLAVLYSNRAGARLAIMRPQEALADSQHSFSLDPKFVKGYLRTATCMVRMGNFTGAMAAVEAILLKVSASSPHYRTVAAKREEVIAQRRRVSATLDKAANLDRMSVQEAEALAVELQQLYDVAQFCNRVAAATALALLCAGRGDDARSVCERGGLPPTPPPGEATGGRGAAAPLVPAGANWRWWIALQALAQRAELPQASERLQEVSLRGLQALTQQQEGRERAQRAQQGAAEAPASMAEVLGEEERRAAERGGDCMMKVPTLEEMQSLHVALSSLASMREAGNALYKQGEFAAAADKYSAALAAAPAAGLAAVLYCNRSAALQRMGQISEALADCGRATAINPTYVKAHSRMADLLMEVRRAGVALTALEDLLAGRHGALPVDERKALNTRLDAVKEAARRLKTPDHYKMMGLERTCSEDEVKRAYKRLALKHHPDKAVSSCRFGAAAGGAGAVMPVRGTADVERRAADATGLLFGFIKEALEVLTDPAQRRKLDMLLSAETEMSSFTTRVERDYQPPRPAQRYDSWQGDSRFPRGASSSSFGNGPSYASRSFAYGAGAGRSTQQPHAAPSRPGRKPSHDWWDSRNYGNGSDEEDQDSWFGGYT